jgi:hypothetical protein
VVKVDGIAAERYPPGSISRRMSRAIFDDAQVAYRDVEHPCDHFAKHIKGDAIPRLESRERAYYVTLA